MSSEETARLFNTFDQLVAAGGGIAIVPAYSPGRERRHCGWAVYKVNGKGQQIVTNKNAAFYEYGKKTFHGYRREERAEALEAAKKWVAETYGETGPWVRNALKDWVPKAIQDQFPIKRKNVK